MFGVCTWVFVIVETASLSPETTLVSTHSKVPLLYQTLELSLVYYQLLPVLLAH